MSQRLYIGDTIDPIYDCVLVTPEGAREKLLSDWLCYNEGNFFGPLKIRIGDIVLWHQLEQIVADVLAGVGIEYPDDVWAFYYHDENITHPTAEELRAWVRNLEKEERHEAQ